MASTMNSKQPRPWHTASFYRARFTMLCFVVCILAMVLPGVAIFLSIAAFFDYLKMTSGIKGIVLPPLDANGAARNEEQKELLFLTMIAFGVSFFVILVTGCAFFQPRSNDGLLMRFLAVVLINLAGWNLLSWIREAFVVLRYYNIVGGSNNARSTRATRPVLTGGTTVTQSGAQAQPVPQAHPQRSLPGRGIHP